MRQGLFQGAQTRVVPQGVRECGVQAISRQKRLRGPFPGFHFHRQVPEPDVSTAPAREAVPPYARILPSSVLSALMLNVW